MLMVFNKVVRRLNIPWVPQDCPGKQNKVYVFYVSGPNPGPGRLPSDSGREGVKFAGEFASVVSMPVSFVSESICWNLTEKDTKKKASKTRVLEPQVLVD